MRYLDYGEHCDIDLEGIYVDHIVSKIDMVAIYENFDKLCELEQGEALIESFNDVHFINGYQMWTTLLERTRDRKFMLKRKDKDQRNQIRKICQNGVNTAFYHEAQHTPFYDIDFGYFVHDQFLDGLPPYYDVKEGSIHDIRQSVDKRITHLDAFESDSLIFSN